jgi:site-specific DNA-cytosine methylase
MFCLAPDFRNGHDMFKQDVKKLKGNLCLYAAGYPCTPFSCLHSHSEMLEDRNARQMWKCVENIAETQPAATHPHIHFQGFYFSKFGYHG